MSDTTNDQHYVPQFYLRGFTIPGHKSLIWQFDKESKKFDKAAKSVRTICTGYRYYRQVREDGIEEPDLLERGFSKQLEHKAAPLFKKVMSMLAEGGVEVPLTPEEYGQLCYCAAIQYTRIPAFRDKIASRMRDRGMQLAYEMVDRQREEGTLPPSVDDLLKKRKLMVKIEDWGTIKTMLEAAVVVSNALMEKRPGFFRAQPNRYFITSDNPISYWVRNFEKYTEKQLEPINPEAEVFFPFSRNYAMVFFPHKSGYSRTRALIRLKCLDFLTPMVQFVNMHTYFMAERFVFSSERDSSLWEPPSPQKASS